MFFNDDGMLDFRAGGFGSDVLDSIFGGPMGFDAGEVIITGRVPGALYVDDIFDGQTGLEHIQPLEFAQNELTDVTVDLVDLTGDAGPDAEPVVEDAPAGLTAANDDDAPSALAASSGKDAEALAPISGGGDGDTTLIQLDPMDLALPPMPVFELPVVTVTAPTLDDAGPVMIGGRAYQSLSFLILDTPFVVGDDYLPQTLRPPINELLGLSDDDGQAWVLPLGGLGSWRLG